jgi:hypothetical protein
MGGSADLSTSITDRVFVQNTLSSTLSALFWVAAELAAMQVFH